MKKNIIIFWFTLITMSSFSQNRIGTGIDMDIYLSGKVTVGPGFSTHFKLNIGEKWAFSPGLSFGYGMVKTTGYASGKNQASGSSAEYILKHRIIKTQLNLDFMKYIRDASNYEGGFYIKPGIGYFIIQNSYKCSSYDTTLYQYNNYSFDRFEKDEQLKNIAIRIFAGYDFEIADRINLFFEGGCSMVFGWGNIYNFSLGIRKELGLGI